MNAKSIVFTDFLDLVLKKSIKEGFLCHGNCLRCPSGGGFELKFFADLIVLSSIIGKEQYVSTVFMECLFLFTHLSVYF